VLRACLSYKTAKINCFVLNNLCKHFKRTVSLECNDKLTLVCRMGGVNLPHRPLFLLPFPNRLELVDAPLRLFLNMNWLPGGAFKSDLTPSRNPIWRLENRKMLGNQRKYELSLLVLQLQIKFQRLPPHFQLCPTQICQCRHCPTSADIRDPKWRPRKPEVEITLELFPLPLSWPTFWVPDVGQCRAQSTVSFLSWASSKIWG